MALTAYAISCYTKNCPNDAEYKIASRWSDGVTSELKTYSLCCSECLAVRFSDSLKKQAACRLAAGETLEAPGIFGLKRGQRDRELCRLPDLEATLLVT